VEVKEGVPLGQKPLRKQGISFFPAKGGRGRN